MKYVTNLALAPATCDAIAGIVHFDSIARQICSYLSPIDLLHVTQSSKIFAAFLLTPANATVWREARQQVGDNFPECPEDLTEQKYACLVFGTTCQVCFMLKLCSKVLTLTCFYCNLISGAEGLVLEDHLATSICCEGVGVIGAGEKCESTLLNRLGFDITLCSLCGGDPNYVTSSRITGNIAQLGYIGWFRSGRYPYSAHVPLTYLVVGKRYDCVMEKTDFDEIVRALEVAAGDLDACVALQEKRKAEVGQRLEVCCCLSWWYVYVK